MFLLFLKLRNVFFGLLWESLKRLQDGDCCYSFELKTSKLLGEDLSLKIESIYIKEKVNQSHALH